MEVSRKEKHGFVTIEPVLGAIFLAGALSDFVLTELYLKRTCEVELSLNATFCKRLGTNTTEGHEAETFVQPHAAFYLMWKTVLQSVLPAVFSLFLGPWSDQYGRKPVIGFSLAGCTLMYIFYFILALIPNLPPVTLLLAIVPLMLLGGYVNMIAACFLLLSDITSEKERSFRMAVMEGVIQAAQLIGLPLAGLIFSQAKKFNFGFLPNFGLSALLSFAALIYLIFFVNESVAVREDSSDKWRRLVDLTHPKQVWRSCVQPRPENGRLVIFLCAFVLGTFIMILEGEAQIAFLFVRLQFGWNLEWFTIVSAILLFLLVLGTFVGSWILPKLFNVSDAYLAVLAFAGEIVNNFLRAAAGPTQGYFLFIGGVVSALKGIISPAIRSLLSKTVPAQDLSKVFAFTFTFESMMPFIAGPLYISVYNSTLLFMPGTAYLLSAGLYFIDAVLILVFAKIQSNSTKTPAKQIEEKATAGGSPLLLSISKYFTHKLSMQSEI